MTNDLLDGMVSRKSIGIHVIEGGNTGKSGIAKQDEEIATETVEENDGHDFEDDSQNVLDEAEHERVGVADVPSVIFVSLL